jgi:hypothetical protein
MNLHAGTCVLTRAASNANSNSKSVVPEGSVLIREDEIFTTERDSNKVSPSVFSVGYQKALAGANCSSTANSDIVLGDVSDILLQIFKMQTQPCVMRSVGVVSIGTAFRGGRAFSKRTGRQYTINVKSAASPDKKAMAASISATDISQAAAPDLEEAEVALETLPDIKLPILTEVLSTCSVSPCDL